MFSLVVKSDIFLLNASLPSNLENLIIQAIQLVREMVNTTEFESRKRQGSETLNI